ncbi:MAG TPA: hypothetical protein VK459_18650, partial [Polyangiaceae bacterium]|nr:hypothetical protein [Polyangiaceae bacterium]
MARTRTIAWFLNFDADEELASPAGYTPRRAVLERSAALTEEVRGLLRPGDVVVPEGANPGFLRGFGDGFGGRAFCPTPRAIRALVKAGATVLPAPPLEILRAVNHRSFSAKLGQTLPGARFVRSIEELEEVIAGPSPTGRFLAKRPFGFAGRGRRTLEATRDGRLGAEDPARPFVEASLRAGEGLQVEPLVERAGDFGLHGFLDRAGKVSFGAATRQICDATGAWKGSERAGDLSEEELRALEAEAEMAAQALRAAGYFGPFGIDAFRWIDEQGRARFNPRCEINARYSMGWPVGMGDRRPDLEDD